VLWLLSRRGMMMTVVMMMLSSISVVRMMRLVMIRGVVVLSFLPHLPRVKRIDPSNNELH
jgi:hypothetical protein